ncbi:MAG: hypothetical protein HY682_00915, partial [Chloroflexi bacterium]|nr:hypothetical protein [Chloroflexota bacterium]
MTRFRGERMAFGYPGIEPRWARGAKDGVGTAYSASSRIWFTLFAGIITEIYYPTVDRPQTRDLQFLVSDGRTFFHEEKRLKTQGTERISDHVLGYRVRNTDPDGRYSIAKEVIANPHQPAVLQRVTLYGSKSTLDTLDLYVLCAPHLEVGGAHNNAYVLEAAGREVLAAEKNGTWLAIAADVPFSKLSCGYVGSSDGWQDLSDNFRMDWEFDQALDGNVALTGMLRRDGKRSFTLATAFGDSQHSALTTLFQSLETPYESHRRRYIAQWRRASDSLLPLEGASGDHGALYHGSYSLLMGHEDKT